MLFKKVRAAAAASRREQRVAYNTELQVSKCLGIAARVYVAGCLAVTRPVEFRSHVCNHAVQGNGSGLRVGPAGGGC
jgi:hypothetical protein